MFWYRGLLVSAALILFCPGVGDCAEAEGVSVMVVQMDNRDGILAIREISVTTIPPALATKIKDGFPVRNQGRESRLRSFRLLDRDGVSLFSGVIDLATQSRVVPTLGSEGTLRHDTIDAKVGTILIRAPYIPMAATISIAGPAAPEGTGRVSAAALAAPSSQNLDLRPFLPGGNQASTTNETRR